MSSSVTFSVYQTACQRVAGESDNVVDIGNPREPKSLMFSPSEHSIVEFTTPEEAQRAIKELSDTPLLGRPVFIREVSALFEVVHGTHRADHSHHGPTRTESKTQDTGLQLLLAEVASVDLEAVALAAVTAVGVATAEASVAAEATVVAMEVATAAVTVEALQQPLQVLSCTLATFLSKLAGKSSRTSSEQPATLSELTSTWASTAVQRALVSSSLPLLKTHRTQFRCTTASTGMAESSR